jgi:hypothetical protein
VTYAIVEIDNYIMDITLYALGILLFIVLVILKIGYYALLMYGLKVLIRKLKMRQLKPVMKVLEFKDIVDAHMTQCIICMNDFLNEDSLS